MHTLLTRVQLLNQTSRLSHTHLNVKGTIISHMWIMLHNLHREFDFNNGTVMESKITRVCRLVQNGSGNTALGYSIDFLFKGQMPCSLLHACSLKSLHSLHLTMLDVCCLCSTTKQSQGLSQKTGHLSGPV